MALIKIVRVHDQRMLIVPLISFRCGVLAVLAGNYSKYGLQVFGMLVPISLPLETILSTSNPISRKDIANLLTVLFPISINAFG